MTAATAVCVAPVLAADVRNYAQALAEDGALRKVVGGAAYHTASATAASVRFWDRVTGGGLYRRTEARRVGSEVPYAALDAQPFLELAVRTAARLSARRVSGPQLLDRVSAVTDRAGAAAVRAGDRLVVGREDGCLRSFRAAHRVGAVTLYDLPIAYHTVLRDALATEEARFPGVDTQGSSADTFAPNRLARKAAELVAADHVLVASDYVRSGLTDRTGVRPDRVTRIPYGCDPGRPFRLHANRKPMILYVGHLSLRKGIPRLLSAWKRLGAYRTHTLRLVGGLYLRKEFLADYAGTFEYVPHVPRSELWEHYAAAQAFVFPSACDGFGLVLNEALSCGTPVVASSNTGAPGFVADGVEGLTYRHGDDDVLAGHLDRVLSRPAETADMGRAAYDLAQRWGWPEYRAEIRKLVATLMAPASGSGEGG